MTELIGESVLLDKEEYEHIKKEYDQLKLKAALGACLLHYLLRCHSDDLWSKETRGLMDECSVAFWGETIEWNIDEEENEDD